MQSREGAPFCAATSYPHPERSHRLGDALGGSGGSGRSSVPPGCKTQKATVIFQLRSFFRSSFNSSAVVKIEWIHIVRHLEPAPS